MDSSIHCGCIDTCLLSRRAIACRYMGRRRLPSRRLRRFQAAHAVKVDLGPRRRCRGHSPQHLCSCRLHLLCARVLPSDNLCRACQAPTKGLSPSRRSSAAYLYSAVSTNMSLANAIALSTLYSNPRNAQQPFLPADSRHQPMPCRSSIARPAPYIYGHYTAFLGIYVAYLHAWVIITAGNRSSGPFTCS